MSTSAGNPRLRDTADWGYPELLSFPAGPRCNFPSSCDHVQRDDARPRHLARPGTRASRRRRRRTRSARPRPRRGRRSRCPRSRRDERCRGLARDRRGADRAAVPRRGPPLAAACLAARRRVDGGRRGAPGRLVPRAAARRGRTLLRRARGVSHVRGNACRRRPVPRVPAPASPGQATRASPQSPAGARHGVGDDARGAR